MNDHRNQSCIYNSLNLLLVASCDVGEEPNCFLKNKKAFSQFCFGNLKAKYLEKNVCCYCNIQPNHLGECYISPRFGKIINTDPHVCALDTHTHTKIWIEKKLKTNFNLNTLFIFSLGCVSKLEKCERTSQLSTTCVCSSVPVTMFPTALRAAV